MKLINPNNEQMLVINTAEQEDFIANMIKHSVKEERNVFAITTGLTNQQEKEIQTLAKDNNYKLYVTETHFDELNWFTLINEPEAARVFARSVVREYGKTLNPDIKRDVEEVIYSVCCSYKWKEDESDTLIDFIKYMREFNKSELRQYSALKRYTDEELQELMAKAICIINELDNISTSKQKKNDLLNFGEDKHIIIYKFNIKYPGSAHILALEQYLRVISNRKTNGIANDENNYTVLIEDLPQTFVHPHFPVYFMHSRQDDVEWVCTIRSVEELRSAYPTYADTILSATKNVMHFGTYVTIYSKETREYIDSRLAIIGRGEEYVKSEFFQDMNEEGLYKYGFMVIGREAIIFSDFHDWVKAMEERQKEPELVEKLPSRFKKKDSIL